MENNKVNNGEILFIYDAKMTNPNGDPDEENRPRMDPATQTNLVSDVRMKRYIRDFFLNYCKGENCGVFVAQEEGASVDATDRLCTILGISSKNDLKKLTAEQMDLIKNSLIDVRLFGAVFPIKAETGKGASDSLTGPVQFNWGYSFNKVYSVDSYSITSILSGKTSGHGNIGKDYRLYYSLIGFYGTIIGRTAQQTRLTDNDLELLDKAIVDSIPLAATRSKTGQYPRFYMRIEYKDDQQNLIGDLRDYVNFNPNVKENGYKIKENECRSLDDFTPDWTKLVDKLTSRKDDIKQIYVWQDEKLKVKPDWSNTGITVKKLAKAGVS
jgi:CRISPR-associated protein Csh2